jgi:hypothetical protein
MHCIYALALFAALSTAAHRNGVSKECKKHPNSMDCEIEYLNSICLPGFQSKDIDLNAPCNMALYIGIECVYGSKPNITKHGIEDPRGPMVSNHTQQLCICESQYFESTIGCESCFNKHGGSSNAGIALPLNVISSLSSAYCAATATPIGIDDFQNSYMQKPQFSTLFPSSSSGTSVTATFSDPLANSTAISLYYTATVTGSEALDVGVFTGTGTTTTLVSDGQIVATAAANNVKTTASTSTLTTAATQGGNSGSSSTTSTSGIGTRQTEAAFAGVLGLIGVVALL